MSRAVVSVRAASEPHVKQVAALVESVSNIVRGKTEAVQLAVACLLARGHLLIEDVPGVGKTTLARALAAAIGGSFRRIQFTSDLLPSDIVGVSIYRADTHEFEFRKGPIFANVILADEINRTTPRTQSALLEAMSEARVSVDDLTHALELPFFVVATQNPLDYYGTYPLPESQMDRFLLRIRLGYPSVEFEKQVLRERTAKDPLENVTPVFNHTDLVGLQDAVLEVTCHDRLLDYAMTVVAETRKHPSLSVGVSTRGALAWYRAAQAFALVSGRAYCLPDDLKAVAIPSLAHRIKITNHQDPNRAREISEGIVADILNQIPTPS